MTLKTSIGRLYPLDGLEVTIEFSMTSKTHVSKPSLTMSSQLYEARGRLKPSAVYISRQFIITLSLRHRTQYIDSLYFVSKALTLMTHIIHAYCDSKSHYPT